MLKSYISGKSLRSFADDKKQHYCWNLVLGWAV